MKIPFFVQEFTEEMEEAAIHALWNESFVGGESVSKFEEEFARYTGQNMQYQLIQEIVHYNFL